MSVIDSDHRATAHRRLIPLGIRFTPESLRQIAAAKHSAANSRECTMLGLLFGRLERNLVSVEAVLGITADVVTGVASDCELLARALDEALSKSKLRPDLACFELVGWCAFQKSDELNQAPNGWLEFHTRRFRRASDVLLILKRDNLRSLSGQVYARLSQLALSPKHSASGRIAIDLGRRLTRPVFVTIAASTESADPNLYARTYEFARAFERAERKQARREAFRNVVEWRPSAWLGNFRSAGAVTSELAAMTKTSEDPARRYMAIAPLWEQTRRVKDSRKLRWVVTAAVIVMALGLAVACLNFLSNSSRSTAATLAPPPQNGGLGLLVHVQSDGFLLTWDRESPAVRSAVKGVLRIQDGPEKRTTELQRSELSNGSIVYRPASDDVDFLLTVYGKDGFVTREGVRALNASPSSVGASGHVNIDALQKNALRKTAPQQSASQLIPRASRSGERKSRGLGAGQTNATAPVFRTEAVPGRQTARDYIGPQPLKVVMPDISKLAPNSLPAAGQVEVEVDVDQQGRVRAARIPAGAPRVSTAAARAAIAAAKQWRFEPAKSHGQAIASKHHVMFDFHMGAR